ncbi:MAG: D-glycerate dehydrogenase [Alphaproteobacteria bacterium]
MAKPRIIVTRRLPDPVERRLAEHFDAVFNRDDAPLTQDGLRHALTDADGVVPTVSDRIDAEVLGAKPLRARLLANFGVGFNHINIEAARTRGLAVTNTPGVLTDATADLAMTLMLMAARRAGEGERHVRAGDWTGWRPTHMMGHQVTGKTLGIIGFGRIGQAVARRAREGFGMTVLYYTPSPMSGAAADGAEACGSVEELLARADFVSLHCPGGGATRHLIDSNHLAAMKPGAILVNTARGDVIDEAALAKALADGRIAGAGLDVYEAEPTVHPDLLAQENVVLLPHLGSATEETRTAMGMKMADNALAFFAGEAPPDRVV